MANFIPFKKYFLYCLKKYSEKYDFQSPFLDIGCGIGDVSLFLGQNGYSGEAIDLSIDALDKAKCILFDYQVRVHEVDFMDHKGKYNLIIFFDVMEHIEDDMKALKKIYKLLNKGGYLIITTPSNKREWGWDDRFYGHYRRYSIEEVRNKLHKSKFGIFEIIDVSFPVFWMMRKFFVFLGLKRNSSVYKKEFQKRTVDSTANDAWKIPVISTLINRESIVWRVIYFIQYTFFKKFTVLGSEIMIIAKKYEN